MRGVARSPVNDAMLLSGLSELALGALTGWPYALVIADPEKAKQVGIKSGARMRQWHLDLILLGGLTVLASTAVEDVPKAVGVPLSIGAWTNANAFGVLVVKPGAKDHPLYRAAVSASFAAVSWGFCGLAVTAARRARKRRR